jgi:P4 family phage/plasmid primase-like protien
MSNNNNTMASKSQTDAKLANTADYSHLQYAQLYHKMNKDKYIYSIRTGWYSYNEFNILENHKGEPVSLLNDVVVFSTNYIKDEMMNLSPTMDDYKKVHNDLFKAYSRVSTSTFSKGIITLLPMLYIDKDIDEKIDAKKELFSFKNMLYDIKEGHFRDIEKKDYILRNTGYDAPTLINDFKLIDDLLFSIFEDKEICDYFLMTTAMSLFTNKFEKLYILTGNGRNGKGVLSTIIAKALGNYYLTGSNDLLTIKDELKNETLSKAKGIRYLAISEPAEDNDKETKFNISMVKKLTGRDVISTRGLYQSSFEYIPQFTMFVSCNKQPRVDETNEAIRNRFRFIHFPFTFVDNPSKTFERQLDVELKDNIEKDFEYRDTMISYLLHLVSQDYDTNKIKEPTKCKEFTNLYFEDNNDVGNYLQKYFEITDDGKDKHRPTTLYDLYKQDGDFAYLSHIKFGEALKSNNIRKIKINGATYYTGLKKKVLVNEEDNNEEDDEQPRKNPLDL